MTRSATVRITACIGMVVFLTGLALSEEYSGVFNRFDVSFDAKRIVFDCSTE